VIDLSGTTGATITADIVNPDCSAVELGITEGFCEIGDGFYLFSRDLDNRQRGAVIFKVSGTVEDVQPLNPEETEFFDPLEATVPGDYPTGTAGKAIGQLLQIRISGPEVFGGPIAIFKGDDYLFADGRQFDFDDLGDQWPGLTGAVVDFVTTPLNTAFTTPPAVRMEILVATGPGKSVRLELTSTETALWTEGEWRYKVVATLSSGSKATLARGRLTVR